jgi:hypothetical protein
MNQCSQAQSVAEGTPRVMRRTARKWLACKRIKKWVKLNRHPEGREFIAGSDMWVIVDLNANDLNVVRNQVIN